MPKFPVKIFPDGTKCSSGPNCRRHKDAHALYDQLNTTVNTKTQVQKNSPLSIEEKVKNLADSVIRPNTLDYDTITMEFGYINEWENPWTAEEKTNIGIIGKIATVVERSHFTDNDVSKVKKLIDSMAPPRTKPKNSNIFSSDDIAWRARDKMIESLANNLLIRRLADQISYEPAEPEENSRLIGLKKAQEAALKESNRPTSSNYKGPILGEVEDKFQEAIARVKRGDEPASTDILKNEDQRSLLPESERIFNTLHPESPLYDANLYLASVYPVNELKDEMDRVGLDGVSVSSFVNGRERGNVYTVMKLGGGTRSFAVYEHRNSDSIIINGKDDWDGKGLPYAADHSKKFFAEFAPEDSKRSAQALTFYMMQAQSGVLESDEELVNKVSRRDWTAILDKSLPGYKEWRQEKVTDTYIAPDQESEEDVLSRLDF